MSRGRKLTMMLQVKFSRSCMENSTLYYARADGPFSTVISHFRIKNRKFPQSRLWCAQLVVTLSDGLAFLCICSFARYFFFHLYDVFSYFSVQNYQNIFEEFLVYESNFFARNITMQLSNFSNRKIRWTLNSLRMLLEFCLQWEPMRPNFRPKKRLAEKKW